MTLTSRITALLLSLCLFCTAAAGCGRQKALPPADDIAAELKGLSSENIQWVELNGDQISSYFGFSDDLLRDFEIYINDNEERFDIIAVFVLAEPANRDSVIKGIQFAVSNASNTFRLTSEAEYKKISGRILAEKEDTVIFCILDNYGKISEYLETLGAETIS